MRSHALSTVQNFIEFAERMAITFQVLMATQGLFNKFVKFRWTAVPIEALEKISGNF
jgi:hypothetical protein